MTTTANGLALREDHAPAALAIQPGQLTWDKFQDAALNQLGLREAGNGDRAVFLHVCQRTGLDPFARQIYMIGRPEEVDGKWGKKWTIQTGIEGWRVIRARAEAREKVRGILGRAVWYDSEGNESKVWFRPEPPTACEITYTVRDVNGVETPYTSVLMFREYVQTKKDGKPTQMWTVKGVHMLEKCVEADVYRKAFPTDFSGIQLDDAMPQPDPDVAAAYQRPAPPVGDLRQRAADRTVTATVVTPEPSPAVPDAPPSSGPAAAPPSAEVAAAGEAPRKPQPASTGQVGLIRKAFERLTGIKDDDETDAQRKERLRQTSRLARVPYPGISSTKELTSDQARDVREMLARCDTIAQLEALLDSGALADDPREDGDGE